MKSRDYLLRVLRAFALSRTAHRRVAARAAGVLCLFVAAAASNAESDVVAGRWSSSRAWDWFEAHPWPVGTNFVPSTAINQLEMWQAETFDPETIDRELGFAASIGMNSMRVFLHDIAWRSDPEGFYDRVDQYLSIADRHGISTLFVLFDGVWNPLPQEGVQPAPVRGVHNSGWVQAPGEAVLADPDLHDSLEPYVSGVISRFAEDKRVYGWDLFNEPDNCARRKFSNGLPADQKHDRACELLVKAIRWARAVAPSQPLTVGVWAGRDWVESPKRIDSISLSNSDLISFHSYDGLQRAEERIGSLQSSVERPMLCTEYMARTAGSTFEEILPLLKKRRIGAYNWGLVAGKSQTIYPWSSWGSPFSAEPEVWFHDVFRSDGTPFSKAEAALIRRLTEPDDAN